MMGELMCAKRQLITLPNQISSRQNAMAKGVGEDSIETRGECVSL